jgi:prolyl 4-hydroxylase
MDQTDLQRASISQAIVQRLMAFPGAFKVPAVNLEIFVLRDFLTAEECTGLIERIDAKREPSTVLGPHSDPDYRTSESCNLDPKDRLVRQVEKKITGLMGIVPSHGETIQGQRYAIGQQFKAHHDFFFTGADYWEQQQTIGGQRTWTAMIFLNKPEAGGQTYFPKAGVKITPRAGNLLALNNMDMAGQPNDFSLHQGLPVEAGVKYIITKWYRERPWGHQPAAGPY